MTNNAKITNKRPRSPYDLPDAIASAILLLFGTAFWALPLVLAILFFATRADAAEAATARLRWDVQQTRPAAHPLTIWQGETLHLMPRLVEGTTPVAVTNLPVVFTYREDALAAGLVREIDGVITNGTCTILWTPAHDVGASAYDYQVFVGTSAVNPRVYGRIEMQETLGWPASTNAPEPGTFYATRADAAAIAAAAVATGGTLYRAEWQAADTILAATIPGSAYCVGGYRNDRYWTVGTEPRYRGYSGAVTSTVDDVIQVDYESDGQFLDAQASIDYLRGLPDDGVGYSVSPTNRASIGTNGYVTTISPGIVTVSATIDGTTRTATDYLGYAAGRALSAWTSGVSGSVRRASQDQVDDALAAAGDSPDTDYWATIEHSTTNYVANTNCWAADADLSGVVVASKHPGDADFGNAQWHGTLISPRHIVLAKHAVAGVPNHLASKSEEIGTQKRFVGQSGTVYERTVSAHYDPMSTAPYTNLLAWGSDYGDTIIGKLDSALPTNDVAVYAVLPSDYADYFPNGFAGKPSGADTFAGGGAVCGIWTGFDRDVHAVEFSSYKSFSSAPTRDETFRPARAGDSGRPAFLWLPSGLTLVLNVTYPTIGPDIGGDAALRAGVGAILAADGYSLQSADLSTYTNFGGGE